MNEITRVRELRAQAPEPEAERLAPQRARLLAAVRAGDAVGQGSATLALSRRNLLVPAVAVTAAACVGVVSQLPGDGLPGGRGRGAAGRDSVVLSAGGSAAALELAADTVERATVTEPKPKQWVYEKSLVVSGVLGQGEQKQKQSFSENWTRWDGTGFASYPNDRAVAQDPEHHRLGRLDVWYGPNQEEKWEEEGYDDRSQRQFWRLLVTLPGDPDAMMKKIREKHAIGDIKGETPAQRDWREISVLFRSVLIPSHVRAGMYRALARIPGARVEKGVRDPLGRDAIGVFVDYPKRTASGWQGRQEFYLDPHTYVYLGERMEDGQMPGARAAWGVVDKPGQRP